MITTYGARLFKKGLPKEKKKQGLEQTLALSLYSDRSIVIPHTVGSDGNQQRRNLCSIQGSLKRHVTLASCHSTCCNRRGGHSWVWMAPASRLHTRRKWLYAFRVGHAPNDYPSRQMHGALSDMQDNDWADSTSLFAGKTLVHPRWTWSHYRIPGTWGFCQRNSTRDLLMIC